MLTQRLSGSNCFYDHLLIRYILEIPTPILFHFTDFKLGQMDKRPNKDFSCLQNGIDLKVTVKP